MYKAKILDRNENDEFLVYCIADSSEEWVTGDRISPYEPEMYEIGASVEAQNEDEECPATVKKSLVL